MPITVASLAGSNQPAISQDFVRRRALDRLYARKAAVEDLIRSLENYERSRDGRAPCIPFIAPQKS